MGQCPEKANMMTRFLTDTYFTGDMARNLITVRQNGGNVSAYELGTGMQYRSKWLSLKKCWKNPETGECMTKNMREAGYNFHAEDLLLLFGRLFSMNGVKNNPDISRTEFDLTLTFIDNFFDADYKSKAESSSDNIECKLFTQSGIHMDKQFWAKELEMAKIIPEIVATAQSGDLNCK